MTPDLQHTVKSNIDPTLIHTWSKIDPWSITQGCGRFDDVAGSWWVYGKFRLPLWRRDNIQCLSKGLFHNFGICGVYEIANSFVLGNCIDSIFVWKFPPIHLKESFNICYSINVFCNADKTRLQYWVDPNYGNGSDVGSSVHWTFEKIPH